MQNQPVS